MFEKLFKNLIEKKAESFLTVSCYYYKNHNSEDTFHPHLEMLRGKIK